MKSNLHFKAALSILIVASVFSFIFINTRTGLADAAQAQKATMVERALQPADDDTDERELRLPDVAVLGRMLGLIGKLLPSAG